MTKFFVDRIFEEHGVVKKDEPVMDLDVFATFILAWRDRSSPQAIRCHRTYPAPVQQKTYFS